MRNQVTIPVFVLLMVFTNSFALQGCIKEKISKEDTTVTRPIPSVTGNQKFYLALGDSYTIGQGVAAEERFPAQTVRLLKQFGINIKDPLYIATTGWTTQNLITAINQQNPQAPFDVVTLLIGVNDQYQRMDTAGYRTRFTQLINKSVELAGNKSSGVVVLSIPDYSATPFVNATDKPRVRKEIDEFNFINKQVAMQNNIQYLDITPSSREAEKDPTLIAGDGLHPSEKEYKKWAERLAPILKTVLQ